MKHVIHLGAHLTASAFLQQNLSGNLSTLRDQGVFYVNDESPKRLVQYARLLRRLHTPEDPSPGKDVFAQLNADIAHDARQAGAHTVLISDDALLGAPMHHLLASGATNPGFYPMSNINLAHVLAGLSPQNTTLLLYTRNAESYLTGLYSDALRNGHTNSTIETFCRSVNFNSIDFDALSDRLRALDSDFTIITRQYERIKLGPETFLRSFLRDAGLDPKPFQLCSPPPQDDLDAIQAEALLHIMAGTQNKRWRFIKNLRDQVLEGAYNPLAPLKLPEWVSDSMRVTEDGRADDRGTFVA